MAESDSLAAGQDYKFTALLLDVIPQVSFCCGDVFSGPISPLHTLAVDSKLQKPRFMKGIINVDLQISHGFWRNDLFPQVQAIRINDALMAYHQENSTDPDFAASLMER